MNSENKGFLHTLKSELSPNQKESWVMKITKATGGKGVLLLISFGVFVFLWSILGSIMTQIYRTAGGSYLSGGTIIFTILSAVLSLVLAGMFWLWLRNKHKEGLGPDGIELSDTNSFGDSHWESIKGISKLCKITDPDEANGFIVSQIEGEAVWVPEMNEETGRTTLFNSNVAIMGIPGSGKTFSVMEPNILQMAKKKECLIINDPSGAAYKKYSKLLKKMGYKAWILNTKNPSASDGWDIVAEITKAATIDNATERATTLAASIWANTQEAGAKPNPFWDDHGKNVLTFAFIYVGLCPYYKGPRTIEGVIKVFETINDKDEKGQTFKYDTIIEHIASLSEKEDPCLAPYRVFQAAAMQRNQVTSGPLTRFTKIATNKSVSHLLSSFDIDMSKIGVEPVAIFLVTNEMNKTFHFIVSAFITTLFNNLEETARKVAAEKGTEERLPVKTWIFIDELIALGYIPNFPAIMANIRKYNIGVVIVVQDVSLFKTEYKESWQTLLGTCATFIFLGSSPQDLETNKYISDICGTQTIKTKARRISASAIPDLTMDMTPQDVFTDNKRALINPEEVGEMPGQQCIVILKPTANKSIKCKLDKFAVSLLSVYDWCLGHQEAPENHLPQRGETRSLYREKITQEVMLPKQAQIKSLEKPSSDDPFKQIMQENEEFSLETPETLSSNVQNSAAAQMGDDFEKYFSDDDDEGFKKATIDPETGEIIMEENDEKLSVIFAPGDHGGFIAVVHDGLIAGDPVPAPPNPVARTGWEFAGWSPDINSVIEESVTYKATWKLPTNVVCNEEDLNEKEQSPEDKAYFESLMEDIKKEKNGEKNPKKDSSAEIEQLDYSEEMPEEDIDEVPVEEDEEFEALSQVLQTELDTDEGEEW